MKYDDRLSTEAGSECPKCRKKKFKEVNTVSFRSGSVVVKGYCEVCGQEVFIRLKEKHHV